MAENETVFTVRGLVLRVTDVGDNDRMLTVLTAEEGKLSVFARSVRKITAGSLSSCQPFAYADFTLRRGRDTCFLREAAVDTSFPGLCEDLSVQTLATYFCEVADEMTVPDIEAGEILQLTLNALWCLSEHKKEEYLIKAVFELRAAAIDGYEPDLSCCCTCGVPSSPEGFVLDIMNGRLFCHACYHKYFDHNENQTISPVNTDFEGTALIPRKISDVTLDAMRFVIAVDAKHQFSMKIPEAYREEFAAASESYLLHHVEHSYRALDYYHSLHDMEKRMQKTIEAYRNETEKT